MHRARDLSSRERPPHIFETNLLLTDIIKVRRREPSLESAAQCRPFAVEHREPRAIAVAPFSHHVLPEYAFVREAEALRGASGRLVLRVAFPFEAAISEVVEHMPRAEKQRFGGNARACDRGSPQNAADFDHTV